MSPRDLDTVHVSDHVINQAILLTLVSQEQSGARDAHAVASALSTLQQVQERIRSREAQHSLAAREVFARLSLSNTERQVIWLLAAIALDPDVRSLVAQVTSERTPDPSTDAIRRVVHVAVPGIESLHEMSGAGTLRKLGLIERSDPGGADAHESRWTWAISRRLLAALHGANETAPEVATLAGPPLIHADERRLVIDAAIKTAIVRAVRRTDGITVVAGPVGSGRRAALGIIARSQGLEVLHIDARKLSTEPATCSKQLCAIARECKLVGAIPLIADADALGGDTAPRTHLLETVLAPLVSGPLLLTVGPLRPFVPWTRPCTVIELAPMTVRQIEALWQDALGDSCRTSPSLLAEQFPFGPSLLYRTAREALARSVGVVETDELVSASRCLLDGRFGSFARRLECTQTWDDLVLADDQMREVIDLMARVRRRGQVLDEWGFRGKVARGVGVVAQFSGPPGTGKTTLASVIARELGMDIYQVDMSRIASKWIGETEKNLASVFDAAEAAHAILLFDEGDGVFAKRSAVSSSNDRHANQETNYLLQRIESFRGVAFITTNHGTNFDPAFQRRIATHVRLETPGEDERAAIWKALLPVRAPTRGLLDYERLGREYPMSGGYIKNAVLRAAYMAADRGDVITQTLLEESARLEWEAMGRLCTHPRTRSA